MQGSYSRAERGTETEADPFSTPEVLVFKSGKEPLPDVLDRREERTKESDEGSTRQLIGGLS